MAALSAVDFSKKPSRAQVDDLLTQYIPDFGTRQFLMKNLYWVENGQLGFRFNFEVFKRKIDQIGEALPSDSIYGKPTLFLRGDRSGYIDENDKITIAHHFRNAKIETISNAGHWLHAENPKEFFEKTLDFLK
jgi:pimeloyl-ACP methyl ester carboxylesterase